MTSEIFFVILVIFVFFDFLSLDRSVCCISVMASLSASQVRHIAKLARLTLSDVEVTRFTTELTGILQYIDMLGEVDTKTVEATAQVTGVTNRFRDDIITEPLATPDELLATSPLPTVDHQIETRSAHGS